MFKRILFIFILLLVLLFAFRRPLTGMALEKPLEKELTDLFGMPVYIDGLRADLITGQVKASRIRFMNQPQFSPGPHFDTDIDFNINFSDLLHKRVTIGTILLKHPYYYIESVAPDWKSESVTNVGTWVHHIKEDDEPKKSEPKKEEIKKEEPKKEESAARKWKVRIGKIVLENGTFVFYSRVKDQRKRKFVFTQLNGFLSGFAWPTPNPARLPQKVAVKGLFGENYPAPFWIKGHSNFATSTVSFNLKGEIPEGILIEHQAYWSGLPIQVNGGTFSLKLHIICVREKMKSHNELVLKSLQVRPGKSAVTFIRGMPLTASIRFLESQKKIDLSVPVHGDISDPTFEFSQAFRRAFQRALVFYTRMGLEVFRQPVRMMTQTGEVVLTTPGKMAEGLGRISDMMKNVPLPPLVPNGKREK